MRKSEYELLACLQRAVGGVITAVRIIPNGLPRANRKLGEYVSRSMALR